MSDIAEQIKKYFDKGVFPKAWVDNVYKKGEITEEELRYILGETTDNNSQN